MKKYYYLYQVQSLFNYKIYIGIHQTYDLEDGYIGSGTNLKRAIKKYGKENFKKTILEFFDNEEDMFKREREIVNDCFVERGDTYNLFEGGRGFTEYNSKIANDARKELLCNDKEFREKYSKSLSASNNGISKELQDKMIKKKRELKTGAAHDPKLRLECSKKGNSPEANKKRKETMKKNNHAKGNKNSQFGTMWITNEVDNKKINKSDSIPSGWHKGRRIK